MMTTAPRRSGVAAAVAVLAILIGGCAARTTAAPSAAAVQSSDTPAEVSPGGWASPTSAPGGTGRRKVLVIVDENHTQRQVRAGMPYLVSLQKTFGGTTHHTAATHPSLPNYLLIAGGRTFGVTDDAAPRSHPIAGTSVFGAALARGRTARTYNETMTRNCQLVSSGNYAVKHNPWAYFVGERTACRTYDVPLTRLPTDISSGHLPNVGMITPNLCNDAHDCSLRTADAFLKAWVPRIMKGPDYTSGRLTIVVTFDEGVGSSQTVETVVINPALHAKVVTAPLTHAGLSRWLYRVSGSTPQNGAATAADFGAAFGL